MLSFMECFYLYSSQITTMKKIVQLFAVLILIASCKTEEKKENIVLVKPTLFHEKMIEHKGQIVDVRTPEEYKEGHIKNAMNIHLYDKDFKDRIAELDKEERVYVYCKVGGRSASAVEIMKANGFTNIVELDGGMDAWLDAKKPIEQ